MAATRPHSVDVSDAIHESQRIYSLYQSSITTAEAGVGGERDIRQTRRRPLKWRDQFHGWKVILFGSYFNVLILLIPAAWAVSIILPESHSLIFSMCILALIPLVKLHDLCTRELARRLGGSKAGLINASLSNLIEIVVSISALRQCELRVVQSALVGSILSKLLLVLGLCFLAGGIRFSEQGFDHTATQISSSLLSVSVGAILLPAAYHFSLSGGSDSGSEWQRTNILRMSHGVSIVLLIMYIMYLLFQLYSHSHLYKDLEPKSSKNKFNVDVPLMKYKEGAARSLSQIFSSPQKERNVRSSLEMKRSDTNCTEVSSTEAMYPSPPYMSAGHNPGSDLSDGTLAGSSHSRNGSRLNSEKLFQSRGGEADLSTVRLVPMRYHDSPLSVSGMESARSSKQRQSFDEDSSFVSSCSSRSESSETELNTSKPRKPLGRVKFSDGLDENGQEDGIVDSSARQKAPKLSWFLTIFLLTSVTICVVVTADWLVEAMDGISTVISKQWIGLILLPAISSIAECATTMNVSVKDQLNLSISVAVGSSIQTALFVVPLMVILAWTMDKPLSLLFDPFVSLVLYISVQTMSYVVGDGKSNWLEGVILLCLYFIIAISFWFYPTPHSTFLDSLNVCNSHQ